MDLSGASVPRVSSDNRYLDSWDKRASINTMPRRVLRHAAQQSYFPKHEQPLCSHPLVSARGREIEQSILTQTAYKFMLGISEHETKVINNVVQKLLCDIIPLPDTLKQALQTVVIDESYHALVAHDFVQQVQTVTGEKALPYPPLSDLGVALAHTQKKLSASSQDLFSLVAVCIAENLITQELLARQADPDVNQFFYEINRDHLADEGRHAKIFTEVISHVWENIALGDREIILDELPAFIEQWMRRAVSLDGDRMILRSLAFTPDEVETVLYDTYPELDFKTAAALNPNIAHIEKWLRRLGIWQRTEHLWSVPKLHPNAAGKKTICDLLTEKSQRYPHHPALRTHDQSLSYSALDRRLSAFSAKLIDAGFQPDSHIGVCVKNRFDYVCAVLGVMKAGMTAVPLAAGEQTNYLADMIELAQIKLIIADDDSINLCQSFLASTTWLCCEALFQGAVLAVPLAASEHPACILFTSGTTGRPKGVVLLHGALAEFGIGAKESFPLRSDDVILQFSSLSFDASLAEIVNALASGATLALPSQNIMDSPAHFFRECVELNVTVLNLPAAYWAQLLKEAIILPPLLRTVLVYGESLSLTALEKWYGEPRQATLINTYGPTEATIGTSFCHLDRHKSLRGRYQLIGKSFPGRTVHVLDSLQRPVPAGTTGEICVSGLAVQSFYLGDDNNPLVPVSQSHPQLGEIYCTGDFGQWIRCPDTGEQLLVFSGRRDRQVKISGSRVELDQIENVLTRHPAVAEALVLVRQQASVAALAAFVLTKPGQDLAESGLRQFLQKELPPYCCPTIISVLQQWPLTPRGKVDKAALLSGLPLVETSDRDHSSTALELAKIWQDLLAVPSIEADSHFFKLGGHSLLAMTLVGKVNERWRAGLTLRRVIESPTFAAMNDWLQGTSKNSATAAPQSQGDTAPLSYAQEAMLLIDRLSGGRSTQYNVAFTVSLDADVDHRALQLAINYAMNRHDALRTIFAVDDGRAAQKIVPLTIDLSKERITFASLQKIVEDDVRTPFALAAAPAWRVRYFEITDRQEVVLYFNLHHIIHDGIAIHILMNEIFQAYEQFHRHEQAFLPAMPSTYRDFASDIRQRVEADRAEMLPFWKRYLHDAKPLRLPIRKPGRGDLLAGGSHTFFLEAGDLESLRRRCFSEDVSLFAALHAGVLFAFRDLSGDEDITVGSIMSLRDDPAHRGLVGMLVNTVLIRSVIPHQAARRDCIQRVHQAILDAMTFRNAPLALLIEELKLPRERDEHKIFDVTVNYHPFADLFKSDGAAPRRGSVQFIDSKTTNVGLAIDLFEWGKGLEIRLAYCKNLYEEKDVASLGQSVKSWLLRLAHSAWCDQRPLIAAHIGSI